MTVVLPTESRHTRLRPPRPAFVDELYLRASIGEFPWLWRGAPETPQSFHDVLWRDVLVQFAIEDARRGEQIGLISAYGANVFHGYAYVSMVLMPDYQRRVWPFEAAALFGNYVFSRFNLANLYAESTDATYDQFRSGVGRLFTEVGRFPGRLLVNGERQDLIITGVSREQWETWGVPFVERCTRPR
jgi:RimJ/RimL family protein N-acetyltransferase